jgi:hypothetical protein
MQEGWRRVYFRLGGRKERGVEHTFQCRMQRQPSDSAGSIARLHQFQFTLSIPRKSTDENFSEPSMTASGKLGVDADRLVLVGAGSTRQIRQSRLSLQSREGIRLLAVLRLPQLAGGSRPRAGPQSDRMRHRPLAVIELASLRGPRLVMGERIPMLSFGK